MKNEIHSWQCLDPHAVLLIQLPDYARPVNCLDLGVSLMGKHSQFYFWLANFLPFLLSFLANTVLVLLQVNANEDEMER